jgi:predicted methyltransferase
MIRSRAALVSSTIAAFALLAGPALAAGSKEQAAAIDRAIKDPVRPDAARALDAGRKPAEVLAYAGVGPGDKVADLMPGAGYYTILFSDIVGPKGKVYAVAPAEILKLGPRATDGLVALQPTHRNIVVLSPALNAFAAPEALDLVWTSWNYHDFHDPFLAPADAVQVNRQVFAALKPGGVYLIIDHRAETGSGLRDTNTLHRIDIEAVKAEVEAAGFVLESASNLLANPADPHKANVFDGSVRGHTDTFILKFRKPGA